jgi:hypothetical protein
MAEFAKHIHFLAASVGGKPLNVIPRAEHAIAILMEDGRKVEFSAADILKAKEGMQDAEEAERKAHKAIAAEEYRVKVEKAKERKS